MHSPWSRTARAGPTADFSWHACENFGDPATETPGFEEYSRLLPLGDASGLATEDETGLP